MSTLQTQFDSLFAKLQQACHIDISSLKGHTDARCFVESELRSCPQDTKTRLLGELFEHGPLTKLLQNDSVTEIIINSPSSIWYEQQGCLKKWEDCFLSDLTYKNFILRVCQQSQVQTHLNQPFADGHWQGFRLHLAEPPFVPQHFHLCLRRHPKVPWSLEKLVQARWCSPQRAQHLQQLVEQKHNVLIVGPTGTGKTSVLNSLLQCVPKSERVLIVEDTDELHPPNPLSTKLLTRHTCNQQLKVFLQEDLIKQALRMRPDRLVLGEVRGGEAKDLLMAFATGHAGGFCTLHAESARQALYRLEMLIQMGAPQWNLQAIRHLIALSFSHIVVIERHQGHRQLKAIEKLVSLESTGFCLDVV